MKNMLTPYRILLLILLTATSIKFEIASAQPVAEASELESFVSLAQQALQQLWDDDVEKALELLGQVADRRVAQERHPDKGVSAAAGALFRSLSQLSADERFELLSQWSLPNGNRSHVRILTTLTPQAVPPSEFARALGERPRDDSFAVASVGDVSGIFCSAWMLVSAADEAGSLRQLTTELESLSGSNTPGAEFVLTLANIRNSRGDAEAVRKVLSTRIQGEGSVPQPAERSDAVLICAALTQADYVVLSEQLAERLNQFEEKQTASPFMTFLRRLRAIAILRNRAPDTNVTELFAATPGLWIAAAEPLRSRLATGTDGVAWLTHEDHVKRLCGPGDDLLLLRYPLSGEWELKGEVANLDDGAGGLTYGGLAFDANEKTYTLQEVHRPHKATRIWPFVAPPEHRLFNRVNLRCDGTTVTFLSNLHPGFSEPLAETTACPWLGLRAFGHGRIFFRNLELTGKPVIPRQVQLVNKNDLRGWSETAGLPTERFVKQFPHNEPLQDLSAVQSVWMCADGVIHGSRNNQADDDVVAQSHLAYMRPCMNGETVTYEFFFESGKSEVHPTVGRVAFLLESRGVRLHWVTADSREWTCLPEDNAIVEPLNRRGPRTLPLKEGDWNTVKMAFENDQMTLWLNEEEVYQRSTADLREQYFGIYHDRNASDARVRNVVLSGDWPESLDAEQMTRLVSQSLETSSGNDGSSSAR